MPVPGRDLLPVRACLLPKGACSRGVPAGGCLLQGLYLLGGGRRLETPETATAASDTHPTGMHSCFTIFPSPLSVHGCLQVVAEGGN